MASLIGTKSNQVPTCGDLGKLAFMDTLDSFTSKTLMDTDTTNIAPSLNLDFANSKVLDSRITFTRSTTGSYYDGKSSAVAEQNLLLQSQTFNTSWTLNAATLIANSVVAPDGTTTAYTITNDTSSSAHGVYQANTTTTGYTYSIYAKTGTTNYLGITNTSNSTLYSGAVFDLTAGTVASSQNCTASIVSVGNGWYRCIVANNTTYAGSYFIASVLESVINPWTAYVGTTKNIYLWGAQLEQRSAATAYIPTTTTAITNYIPTLQTAAAGVARFDHNPTTGESLGLLIEESRTNLLTYSEQFDAVAWTKIGCSINANTLIAPDGTQTSDKIVENTSLSGHNATQLVVVSTATAYTSTIYAKAGERRYIAMYANNPGVGKFFDLLRGVVLGDFIGAPTSATITAIGNGWYRCSITATTTSTNATGVNTYLSVDGINVSYTGDGWSGCYVWGAQLEAGAFATSYIPTVASQVTRSSDAASMTGTNFSSWYNNGQGSIYAEASALNFGNTFVKISDGTQNNRIEIRTISTSDSRPEYFVGVNGVLQADLVTSAISANIFYKYAVFYQTNNFSLYTNGVSSGVDALGALPIVNQLQLSSNNYYKKLTYYPVALSPAELQEITA